MSTPSEKPFLPIPVGENFHALIPLGIGAADYQMLLDTLELWKHRIVGPPPPTPDSELPTVEDVQAIYKATS